VCQLDCISLDIPTKFYLQYFFPMRPSRLHMFRKLTTDKLPATDCHASLRDMIIKAHNLKFEDTFCVSVAFDWYGII